MILKLDLEKVYDRLHLGVCWGNDWRCRVATFSGFLDPSLHLLEFYETVLKWGSYLSIRYDSGGPLGWPNLFLPLRLVFGAPWALYWESGWRGPLGTNATLSWWAKGFPSVICGWYLALCWSFRQPALGGKKLSWSFLKCFWSKGSPDEVEDLCLTQREGWPRANWPRSVGSFRPVTWACTWGCLSFVGVLRKILLIPSWIMCRQSCLSVRPIHSIWQGRLRLGNPYLRPYHCTYVMQTMLLPLVVCKKLDQICQNFVWGNKSRARKIHLVKWDDPACKSCNLGEESLIHLPWPRLQELGLGCFGSLSSPSNFL